jgi:4-hydroxy-tetrahydrodipicolinate reductase
LKLALIGHGAMGHLVELLARARGYNLGAVIDSSAAESDVDSLATLLRGHDAAIDFSVAPAVQTNVAACMRAGIPLVEGTTGWNDQTESIHAVVIEQNGALVYGANFSVGVNLFYRMVNRAAELITQVDGYEAFIEEAHHSRKRDAPSGTALRLRDIVEGHVGGKISVASTRAGSIPGTHRVGFDSAADQITLTHTARSREGFASGALMAADWIIGRRGVFQFSDVIDEIVERERGS